MINMFCLFPGFDDEPDIPPPPPPPPTPEDPAIAAAREKLRLSEKKRKGRRASILTDTEKSKKEGLGTIRRATAISGEKTSDLG